MTIVCDIILISAENTISSVKWWCMYIPVIATCRYCGRIGTGL